MMAKPSPDPFFVLRGHNEPVSAVHFVPSQLFSGSVNGTVYGWDLETFRKTHFLHGHKGAGILWIGHVGDTLLTQGRDGFVAVWKQLAGTLEKCETLPVAAKGFCQCNVLPSAGLLAAPCDDDESSANVWDLEKREIILSIKQSALEKLGMAMCVKVCDGGNTIVIGYEDGSVASFDCRCGKRISRIVCFQDPIMCMDIDDITYRRGLCGSVTNKLCEFEGFENLRLKREVTVTNDGFASVAIRSDGRIAASGGWDGRVRIFGWKSLKPLAVLDFHQGSVQSVAFAEDSMRGKGMGVLAAAAKDGAISLWSLYTQ